MHPKLLALCDNVEDQIRQVRESGPLSEEKFQLFVLTTLAEMLKELGGK